MTVHEYINAWKYGNEIFVPVTNFEERFFLSNWGRLISHDNRKSTIGFMRGFVGGSGYIELQLRQKPECRKVRLHTLVAEHFCPGKSEENYFVNHKDGNKLNNYFENLEWVTPARNVQHAVETGLMDFKGSKHKNSKLTESQILEIRDLRSKGFSQQSIAGRFGINRRTVGDILAGNCWGWLTSDSLFANEGNQDAT